MAYTLGEAAKAVGRSKATISKAIKSGRISAVKEANGRFSIEPVELHRVYPVNVETTVHSEQKETGVNTTVSSDLMLLQARLDAADARLSDRDATIEDLREDRDRWRQQATTLLEDKRSRGWWRRLLGH